MKCISDAALWLLSPQQVLLQVGDKHLLPPVGEVLLHPDQLGHNVEEYLAWQGQNIQGECLFDP